MTPAERFADELARQYADLFTTDPDYRYAAERVAPDTLARKMTEGLIKGSANKDGEGIRRACKVLGIRHAYTAIRAYLSGEVSS